MNDGLPDPPSGAELRLRTRRLDLLPIDRSHASVMFSLLNDVAMHEFTGGKPPADVETLSRRYEGWEERRAPDGSELWLNWVLRERQLNEVIGHVQAGVRSDCAYVAWVIGSRWQRRGYASEAAARLVGWLLELGVKEIRASIHPEHIASIRVAENVGLERTDLREDSETVWRLRV